MGKFCMESAMVVMAIALFIRCNAEDPYSSRSPKTPPSYHLKSPNAPPPPHFRVAGKTTPPESMKCYTRNTRCTGRTLRCPKECPERRPANPKAKGCYIDCHVKCEAVCKNRRPNCKGLGAVCYDPRFVGGDGVMFYFHGQSDEYFCLVSDTNLQINAHFIGNRPLGRRRDYTWVQSLGILFSSHTFTVGANRVSSWVDNLDQFFFTFDNESLVIPQGHLSVWNSPSADLTVERTAETNSILVSIPQMVELSINVVPITENDNRVHNYQLPSDDCFAHLEMQFKFPSLSPSVEGVLGQTYKPDFKNPVKIGVPMPIMSGEDRYRTSSLLAADCKLCQFLPNSSLPHLGSLLIEPTTDIDCTSKMGNGHGIVCRK